MSPDPPLYGDTTYWHRRLCPIADQIVISGDLEEDEVRAIAQLRTWTDAGVTHILDTRSEWSDADLVADNAPEIVYGWIGTDDAGLPQSDEWFDAGVAFAKEALGDPGSVLLVHCHMGINRGPSMAYRVLLEQFWDPIDALDTIRDARPIAAIAYASDALDHYHRSHEIPTEMRTGDRDRFEAWQRGYSPNELHLTRHVPDEPGRGGMDTASG
jgi:protein-tyrosine phosphatase